MVAFFMIFFFSLTPKHNNFSYGRARQALNSYFMHHETLSQVDEQFAGVFFLVLLYIKYSSFLHESDFSYQKFTVTAAQQYERTVTHAETKN